MTRRLLTLLLTALPLLAQTNALDDLFAQMHDRLRTGFTVQIARADGTLVYDRTFGDFGPDRPVALASATKWLSGAVLMSLVEDGTLSLDDRVDGFLPYFTGEHGEMRVRQLFSHTSGLPAESALEDGNCLSDRRTTLDRCAQEIAGVPLDAKPGTAFAYGGLSMQVAGRVAETASGQPWSELFIARLAQPLGLTRTLPTALPSANPGVGGSAISTARDYLRFLLMLLNDGTWEGQRILRPETVRELLRDQTNGAEITFSPYQRWDRLWEGISQTRYGIGNWQERADGQETRRASSTGAFGFTPWLDRDLGLVGVISIRDSNSRVIPYYLRMREILERTRP